MSELDFNDFFKQVKKDRDDRFNKTLLKQNKLEEDLWWEEYSKKPNDGAVKKLSNESINDGN